jgi:cholest-4-en-3-one 26-monooxygenase
MLFDWSNRMIGADDPEYQAEEGNPEEATAAAAELYMYAMDLRQKRSEDPRDDIVTKLINGEINGDRLTEAEFDMFILLLAVAGNETTRNATAHGMHALLTMWHISANRDEEVFDDPFRFDIQRTPNDHIAFGGGGAHYCLGTNLARMELRLIFDEIVQRLPDMAFDGDVERLRSNFIGGIKHMPITFTPGERRHPADAADVG